MVATFFPWKIASFHLSQIFSFVQTIDTIVHAWFAQLRTEELTEFFLHITQLGNWQTVAFATLYACVYLHFCKLPRTIVALLSSLSSSALAVYLIKILAQRPRPTDSLIELSDFSFPSGHAAVAVSLYGFLAYLFLLRNRSASTRVITFAVALTVVLLLGGSRLYLGVHYLSDVLVGYCIGCAGLLVGSYILRKDRTKNELR